MNDIILETNGNERHFRHFDRRIRHLPGKLAAQNEGLGLNPHSMGSSTGQIEIGQIVAITKNGPRSFLSSIKLMHTFFVHDDIDA